ncbi:MAG: DNA-processing protein DprA [Gemmataceae bacterium]
MQPLSDEQHSLLTLHLIRGLGAKRIASLVKHFGSAWRASRATALEWSKVPYMSERQANQFLHDLQGIDVDAERKRADEHNVSFCFRHDSEYPKMLGAIEDAPQVLYVRGELLPQDSYAIGIVGSRHCTKYGRTIAERLAYDLSRAGYTIVSGLARGIDGAAHKGAVQAGGRTIAVLAGGLSSIYPPENKDLAQEVQTAGALLTESNMLMEPVRDVFPARNRIISGLCHGVVIVEAKENSGALITARHATAQKRFVFAIPGPVDSGSSAGPHQLIREGATLIREARDILEDLQGHYPIPRPIPGQSRQEPSKVIQEVKEVTSELKPATEPPVEPSTPKPQENQSSVPDKPRSSVLPSPKTATPLTPPPAPSHNLNGNEKRIWDFLDAGPKYPDEITQELEIEAGQLAFLLSMMELNRVLRKLPGGRYERC